MIAKYYWDFELKDIEKRTTNEKLLQYFIVKKSEAKSIINSVSTTPITEVVAKLNTIDEQLRLFFFYIFEDFDFEHDEETILALVQSEYKKTFFEEIAELQNNTNNLSFIYLIDDVFPKKPLWELSIMEIAAKTLDTIEIFDLNDWIIIANYYQYLRYSAKKILADLNANNFNRQFPKLLLIDSKCRNIVEMLKYKDFFSFSEIEFVLIVENQAVQSLNESFAFQETRLTSYSFRRQVLSLF